MEILPKRGVLHLATNSQLPKNTFVLAEADHEVVTGEEIKGGHLQTLLASQRSGATDADKLFAIGVSRRENAQGKDTLLITHPDQEVDLGQ